MKINNSIYVVCFAFLSVVCSVAMTTPGVTTSKSVHMEPVEATNALQDSNTIYSVKPESADKPVIFTMNILSAQIPEISKLLLTVKGVKELKYTLMKDSATPVASATKTLLDVAREQLIEASFYPTDEARSIIIRKGAPRCTRCRCRWRWLLKCHPLRRGRGSRSCG